MQHIRHLKAHSPLLLTQPMRTAIHAVTLNETERLIRNLLVDFCSAYNASQKGNLVLRITGGWVRDKLLGMESNDVDVAINSLTGEEFVTQLVEYIDVHGIDSGDLSIHTIKKNPEKSKHLETCTTRLFGCDVDFVNLRSEKYTEDSRVPVIDCGTAEEDALRRDATLNAIFYNLNEDKLEDFTGRGIEDLKNGVLKTPLPPLQTFLDDPLRVLRLVRFGARFGFSVEAETLEAMKHKLIAETLLTKISRERVGVEIDKILTSTRCHYGLRLINYVGLVETIFNCGSLTRRIQELNSETAVLEEAAEAVPRQIDAATQAIEGVVGAIQRYPRLAALLKEVEAVPKYRKTFWLSTILEPYGALQVRTNPKKATLTPYVAVILREGVMFGRHDCDATAAVLTSDKTVLGKFFDGTVKRLELGMYMRRLGDSFVPSILYNVVSEVATHVSAVRIHDVPDPEARFETPAAVAAVCERYESLLEHIHEQKLEDVFGMKPIVDGKTLSKALNRRPGPWMALVTNDVLLWSLDRPDGTLEECIAYIKALQREE